MTERRSLQLLDGATVRVFDVRCSSPAGAPGPDECADVTQVVFPLDGVFEVHRGRDSVVADASSVVVLEAGREHRVGHPVAGGDRSMVLVFPPEVVETSLHPDDPRGGPVGSRAHLGARVLSSALRRGTIDELEAEELALVLMGLAGGDLRRANGYRPAGPHQRERVERVRALLAAEPHRRWRLAEVAGAVHCSPFHLATQFRALSGTSIARCLLRLRLALALERLAEGEEDLAGLAADLGFASHSHFSARFRSEYGLTPRFARSALTAGRLPELRTFVTAEGRAAS